MDHALSRVERGLVGFLIVDGPLNDELMHKGRPVDHRVQIESHPYLPEWGLLEFCQEHGIVLQAFAALGHALEPKVLGDPVIKSIAQRVHKTPAQVALASGGAARHRFPDHLYDTSPYPREL